MITLNVKRYAINDSKFETVIWLTDQQNKAIRHPSNAPIFMIC